MHIQDANAHWYILYYIQILSHNKGVASIYPQDVRILQNKIFIITKLAHVTISARWISK